MHSWHTSRCCRLCFQIVHVSMVSGFLEISLVPKICCRVAGCHLMLQHHPCCCELCSLPPGLLPAVLSLTVKTSAASSSTCNKTPTRWDRQAPGLPGASGQLVSGLQLPCSSRLCASRCEGRMGGSLNGCTTARLMLLSFPKPCLAMQAVKPQDSAPAHTTILVTCTSHMGIVLCRL